MHRLLILMMIPLLLMTLLAGCSQVATIEEFEGPGVLGVTTDSTSLYNQFGFDLYRQLVATDSENLMISPLSIALALAMTYNGAEGETREAIAATLGISDMELTEVNQINKELMAALQGSDVALSIANSIWLRRGLPFRQEFLEANRNFYNAEVRELDFDHPRAVQTINKWVYDQTNGLIDGIMEEPIDPLTLMFLLNAVYFQGDWSSPFNANSTRDDVFHTATGPVTVPFMHQSGGFEYLEQDGLQAIRLPYGKGNMAMYIFLPQNLTEFHQGLTLEKWEEWLAGFTFASGRLAVPKFELEYEQQLNDALKALGMSLAFDPYAADFSQMADIQDNIYISEVKHKTYIRVDEKGTEAAAVTSVEMRATSLPAFDFALRIDRPFFYLIHDSVTDTVLFMGSVIDPS